MCIFVNIECDNKVKKTPGIDILQGHLSRCFDSLKHGTNKTSLIFKISTWITERYYFSKEEYYIVLRKKQGKLMLVFIT